MMEEICDDANGESSFEFVSGKIDEMAIKAGESTATTITSATEVPPMATNAIPPPPTGNMYTMTSASNTGLFVPLASTSQAALTSTVPAVPMYDPSKHAMKAPSILYNPVQIRQPISPFIPPGQGYFPTPPAPGPNPVSTEMPEAALELPLDDNYATPGNQMYNEGSSRGVWGWIKGNDFLNKVAEKAKNSVDSVITTLDPGMKEIIYSGGDLHVVVASTNEAKVSAIRDAFLQVFGRATVEGVSVQATSIAAQPVGFSAGVKAVEERISNLHQRNLVSEGQVVVAIENFLAELTPGKWFDLGCLLLQDQLNGINLQIYTQAVPVATHHVMQAKEQTPPDYPQGWSGFAVTIGQVLGPALGVHHSNWHEAVTGTTRKDMLYLAAKTLAGMYQIQSRK